MIRLRNNPEPAGRPQYFFWRLDRSEDPLKIDIEGYEYVLLADERFADLKPQAIVLERHETPDFPNGGASSAQRLRELGYQIFEGNDRHQSTGLLWGLRNDRSL